MPFVADVSITLAWAFDEVHPRAVLARERLRTDEAVRPEPVVVRAAQYACHGRAPRAADRGRYGNFSAQHWPPRGDG